MTTTKMSLRDPYPLFFGEANTYARYHIPVKKKQKQNHNCVKRIRYHIFFQYCYAQSVLLLMDLVFTCSKLITIYNLNVNSLGVGMGREIFSFYLESTGSLCSDGTGDQ